MKKNFYYSFIIFVIFAFAHTAQGKMHVFIIIDIESGVGADVDAQLIKAQVELIGGITNDPVQIHEYYSTDLSWISDLENLTVNSDDVIWFHYSGHGGNSGDGWPQYDAPGRKVVSSTVDQLLVSKSVRLSITSFDACNIGSTENTWASRTLNIPGSQLALLFKKSRGNILISAASDGRLAYGESNTGGFLTTSFIKALNSVSYEQGDDAKELWERVLIMTRDLANARCVAINKPKQSPKWDNAISRDPIAVDIYNTPKEADRSLPGIEIPKKNK